MVKRKRYFFKVSKFHQGRLHIEIPATERDDFQPGEQVEVQKL